MSFCPNCGTEVDEGSKYCGECGARIVTIQDSTEAMPWKQDASDETEAMPWKQGVSDETEAMPWEQGVSDETEAMPWEQGVSDETEAMPWEQGVSDETQTMPWEQGNGVETESFIGEETSTVGNSKNPEGTMRPSQIKRARQKEAQTGSSITLKKPNINIKGCKDNIKRLSKMQIFVIAEALCLILIIGIFCGIGNSKTSAQSVAKKYIQAYADQNWSKVYDLTDFPEGTYLQKDQFIECMNNVESVKMDNFEISEALSSSGYTTDSLFGYSGSESSVATSSIRKFFNVQYTVKGQESGSMFLELTKQSEKSMLFFDTWKVAANDMVINNYYISVPIGATVTLDGIVLNEADKLEDTGYGMDEYSISIFSGTHKIQVALPWFQIYENEFYAYSGDGFTVSDMSITEDGALALQAKMQEALEKFYQAALANKDFSEVSDLFMDDYSENAKESYEYLVECLNDSDYYTLNEVTFDDFECEFHVNDSGISAHMSYDYNMNYTYTRSSWYSSKKTSETRTDDGTSYMTATFGYDGETYKLTYIYVGSVL